jgi:hypothetical protein
MVTDLGLIQGDTHAVPYGVINYGVISYSVMMRELLWMMTIITSTLRTKTRGDYPKRDRAKHLTMRTLRETTCRTEGGGLSYYYLSYIPFTKEKVASVRI